MKNEAISKINKMGKISHVFAVITKVFLTIGLVCTILGAIVIAFLPDDLLTVGISGNATVKVNLEEFDIEFSENEKKELLNDIYETEKEIDINGVEYLVNYAEVGDATVDVKASAEVIEFTLKDLWIVLFMSILMLGMSIVTVIFIDKLCLAIKNCETPFEQNVIKSMQNLAYALIPWSVLSTLSDSIVNSFFTGRIRIMVGIDLGMVIVVLIVFAISYVFKYGAVLQQESDETL